MAKKVNKEVDFTYCNKCIYKDNVEDDSPCDECMSIFFREDSHKPVYFEEKK